MTSHLNDHEIAAVLAGEELEPAAAAHRSECLVCRQRVRSLEELLAARRAELAAGAPDWQAQREAVLARLAPRPTELAPRGSRRWRRPLLALAAMVLLALGVRALWPVADPAPAEPLPVADILAEAESLLASDEIPGFAVIDPGLDTLTNVSENGHS